LCLRERITLIVVRSNLKLGELRLPSKERKIFMKKWIGILLVIVSIMSLFGTMGILRAVNDLKAEEKLEQPETAAPMVELLSFTLSTDYNSYGAVASPNTFSFEKGMTWEEFVNSEYNVNDYFIIEDSGVCWTCFESYDGSCPVNSFLDEDGQATRCSLSDVLYEQVYYVGD